MPNEPIYGSNNPHPLLIRETELIWEGKYDEYDKRREVYIIRKYLDHATNFY